MGGRVDGGTEVEATVGIPVAIDILWARLATTRLWVIVHHVRDGVADMAIVTIEYDGTLVSLDVVVVIDVQRIGELRLQATITRGDIKRIRVIANLQQLGDIGLTGVATIVDIDVLLVAELIVEVNGRREVGHRTHRVDIASAIVLNEVRTLGLHQDTHVIVILLLPMAQGETDVVRIVLILRIATEVLVEQSVHCHLVEVANPGIPLTILGLDASEGVDCQMTEVIGLSVALVLVVAQLIVELQVGALPEGLAIEGAEHITLVVAGRGVVAGRIVR